MIIVHYEVYVLESRGWMLHARFPRTERETAIAEAKELEQSLGARVRVVRETYYTEDNSFEEAEIYSSSNKVPEKPKSGGGFDPPSRSVKAHTPPSLNSGGPQRQTMPKQRVVPRSGRTRPRSREEIAQARTLLARLTVITAISLALALLAIKLTPNAIMFFWQLGFNWTVTPDSYSRLLFIIFTSTFLLAAVPMTIRFLPRRTPRQRSGKRAFGLSAAPVSLSDDPAHDRAVKKSLDKLAHKALAEQEHPTESHEAALDSEDLPEITPADLPEIRPDPDEPLPEIHPDIAASLAEMNAGAKSAEIDDDERERQEWEHGAEPQREIWHEDPPSPVAAEPQPEKSRTDNGSDTAASHQTTSMESIQPTIMRFLNGAVNQAKILFPNMDALTKFALHLYLAGAVETLCDFKKLGDDAKADLVALALETLGTRGDLSRKFYEKLEEYLMEPRYLGVVQAGRDAMGDFLLGDEAGAHRALRDALQEWGRRADKKAQIVTVMFTDMVGSTDMTQARGDAAAQEVVRRHNSIVRTALAQFGGKEIKHTGDGIMASFNTAAAAVEATIAIQRQVDQHNRRLPAQSLHLRIGLNAGEPIEEEDDLFGATVQLAARVCAATNADQVLCTGVVKELTVGKGAAVFHPVGEKFLKGFRDAVPLFEVVWKS